jgi:hypothetical protein
LRTYKIKDKKHFVYDLESELPEGICPVKNWRDGRVGDWVQADDNAYIQVLERKKMGKKGVVRTCVGTYLDTGTMDTAEREDRYNLSGKSSANRIKERKKANGREIKFARKVLKGTDAVKAYMEVYDANSKNYAKTRAALLLKTERIVRLMNPSKEDLDKVFNKLNISLELLIGSVKDDMLNGKNGSDRLNAAKMLWEAFGVVEKKTVTDVVGVFQGFEQAQLKKAERPSLPEYETHGDEAI